MRVSIWYKILMTMVIASTFNVLLMLFWNAVLSTSSSGSPMRVDLPFCSESMALELLSILPLASPESEHPTPSYDKFCREQNIKYRPDRLASLIDKHNVKQLVREWEPGLSVAKKLAYVTNPETITEELIASFPQSYLLKATHASGMILLIQGNTSRCLKMLCPPRQGQGQPLWDYLRKSCGLYLGKVYKPHAEPTYSFIQPGCLFEEKVPFGPQGVAELKIHFNGGHLNHIHYFYQSAHTNKRRSALYTGSGRLIAASPCERYFARGKTFKDIKRQCDNPSAFPDLALAFPDLTLNTSQLLLLATRLERRVRAEVQTESMRIDFFVTPPHASDHQHEHDRHRDLEPPTRLNPDHDSQVEAAVAAHVHATLPVTFSEFTFTPSECNTQLMPVVWDLLLGAVALNRSSVVTSECTGSLVSLASCRSDAAYTNLRMCPDWKQRQLMLQDDVRLLTQELRSRLASMRSEGG